MATLVLDAIRNMSGSPSREEVYRILNEAYRNDPHIANRASDVDDITPLMLAAQKGNYYAVEWLFDTDVRIHKGSNPKLKLQDKKKENTALTFSVSYQDKIEQPDEAKSLDETKSQPPASRNLIGSIEARREILKKMLAEAAQLEKTKDHAMDRDLWIFALRANNQRFMQMHQFSKDYVIAKLSEAYAKKTDVVLNQVDYEEWRKQAAPKRYSYAFLDSLRKKALPSTREYPALTNAFTNYDLVVKAEYKDSNLFFDELMRPVLVKQGDKEQLMQLNFTTVKMDGGEYYQEEIPVPPFPDLKMFSHKIKEKLIDELIKSAKLTYFGEFWRNVKYYPVVFLESFINKLTTMDENEIDQMFLLLVRKDDHDQTPVVSTYENLDLLSSQLAWGMVKNTLTALVIHLTIAPETLYAFSKFFTSPKYVDKFGEIAFKKILDHIYEVLNQEVELEFKQTTIESQAALLVTRFSGDLSGEIYRKDLAKMIKDLKDGNVSRDLNDKINNIIAKGRTLISLNTVSLECSAKISEALNKYRLLSSKITLSDSLCKNISDYLTKGLEIFYQELFIDNKKKVLEYLFKKMSTYAEYELYVAKANEIGIALDNIFQKTNITIVNKLISHNVLPVTQPINLLDAQKENLALHILNGSPPNSLYDALSDQDKSSVLDLMIEHKFIQRGSDLLTYVELAKNINKPIANIFVTQDLQKLVGALILNGKATFKSEFLALDVTMQSDIIAMAVSQLRSPTELIKPEELYPLLSMISIAPTPTQGLANGLGVLGNYLLLHYLNRLNQFKADTIDKPEPEVKVSTSEVKSDLPAEFTLEAERLAFENFFSTLHVNEKITVLEPYLQNNAPILQINYILSLLDETLKNNPKIDAWLKQFAELALKNNLENSIFVFEALPLPEAKKILTKYIKDNLPGQKELPALALLMQSLNIKDYQSLFSENEEKSIVSLVDNFMEIIENQKPQSLYLDIMLALINKNKIEINTYELAPQKSMLKQIYSTGNIDQFKIFIQNKPYEVSRLETETKVAAEYNKEGVGRIEILLATMRLLEKPELAFTTTQQRLEVFNQVDAEDRAALRAYFMETKYKKFILDNFRETSGEQQEMPKGPVTHALSPSAPTLPPGPQIPSAPVISERIAAGEHEDEITFTNQGRIEYLSVNNIGLLLDHNETRGAGEEGANPIVEDFEVHHVEAPDDVDQPGLEGVADDKHAAPDENPIEGKPNPKRIEQPITTFLSDLDTLWKKLPKELHKDPRIIRAIKELPASDNNKPSHKRNKSG